MVDAFPCYFKKEAIKKSIVSSSSKESTKVGVSITEKIRICKEYRGEEVLGMYMNKEHRELIEGIRNSKFKTFVHQHVEMSRIIDFVVNMITGLSNAIEIKASVSECQRLLNKEIEDFNKDLLQISEELSYRFTSDLHNFCLHLLWKWHE